MLPKFGHKRVPMKRSTNIRVLVAIVSQWSTLEYSHIKVTFLLLTFGGIAPRRPLISTDVMESLTLILSSPNFKLVMAEKSVLASPHQYPKNEKCKWYPRIAPTRQEAIGGPYIHWYHDLTELEKRSGSWLH